MKTHYFFTVFLLSLVMLPVGLKAQDDKPLRLGVAGISHAHLNEVISRIGRGDFVIVGVAERDKDLLQNNRMRKYLDDSVFFEDLDEMLDKAKPEAVIVYEPIFDHLRVVEACAPRGIHVMVEKPLAVNMNHARKIVDLARKYNILVLTNYETTWYDTNRELFRRVKENNEIGNITRIEVYDGHQGPVEIGCGKKFTDWLTHPKLNGGGAVIDFGCYGANLVTWLLGGEKPLRVYGVLNRQKPDLYPEVDDDATIILEYPQLTVQIMASWNWPMSRKDMHVYGTKGYIYQDTPRNMRVYSGKKLQQLTAPRLKAPYNDSFYYLKAAVRKQITVKPTDLSSLENNLIVVEILDAAIKSARQGKPVKMK